MTTAKVFFMMLGEGGENLLLILFRKYSDVLGDVFVRAECFGPSLSARLSLSLCLNPPPVPPPHTDAHKEGQRERERLLMFPARWQVEGLDIVM